MLETSCSPLLPCTLAGFLRVPCRGRADLLYKPADLQGRSSPQRGPAAGPEGRAAPVVGLCLCALACHEMTVAIEASRGAAAHSHSPAAVPIAARPPPRGGAAGPRGGTAVVVAAARRVPRRMAPRSARTEYSSSPHLEQCSRRLSARAVPVAHECDLPGTCRSDWVNFPRPMQVSMAAPSSIAVSLSSGTVWDIRKRRRQARGCRRADLGSAVGLVLPAQALKARPVADAAERGEGGPQPASKFHGPVASFPFALCMQHGHCAFWPVARDRLGEFCQHQLTFLRAAQPASGLSRQWTVVATVRLSPWCVAIGFSMLQGADRGAVGPTRTRCCLWQIRITVLRIKSYIDYKYTQRQTHTDPQRGTQVILAALHPHLAFTTLCEAVSITPALHTRNSYSPQALPHLTSTTLCERAASRAHLYQRLIALTDTV